MVRPFLVDAGLDGEEIAWLLGVGASIAGGLGALVGGAGASLLGRRTAILGFGLLQAVGVTVYALPASGTTLWSLCLFENFAGGTATAALFTVMMDACHRSRGATDYTVQASAVVLGTGLFSAGSGFVAESLGYTAHFGVSGILAVAGTLLLTRRLGQRDWSGTGT